MFDTRFPLSVLSVRCRCLVGLIFDVPIDKNVVVTFFVWDREVTLFRRMGKVVEGKTSTVTQIIVFVSSASAAIAAAAYSYNWKISADIDVSVLPAIRAWRLLPTGK